MWRAELHDVGSEGPLKGPDGVQGQSPWLGPKGEAPQNSRVYNISNAKYCFILVYCNTFFLNRDKVNKVKLILESIQPYFE